MKRQQNRPPPHPAQGSPRSASRWSQPIAAGLILFLVAIVAVVWYRRTPQRAEVPAVNLAGVAPPVAIIIEKHLNAVRSQSRSGPAWGQLGALLWSYRFRLQACQCLARAEQLDPDNPRWPYFHGLALLTPAPGEALQHFRRAAVLSRNDPEAPRFRVAQLLAEQANWDEAIPELDQLLTAKPEFAPARLLRARAALAKKDIPRALELAGACQADPRTARSAWALLAMAFRQQGDLVAAQKAVERSSALPPDEGFGDPFEAELTRLRPDARALTEQAHQLLAAGRLPEATSLIDLLLANHSDYPDTWLLAGRLQALRKELARAEQFLRRHLELSPRSIQGLFQLGSVLLGQDRYSEAAAVFAQATEFQSDFGAAHFNRGYALARAGRKSEAIAAFKESLRYNPEHVDSYILLADLNLQLGDRESALRLLGEAESLDPANPRLKSVRDRATRVGH